MNHADRQHKKATYKEWLGLAIIALPCLVYAMDLNVLNLALPAISLELKPSASELLWIIDIYGFLLAGFLITMGTLGDRIGRRKILMIGASAFAVTSIIAAFSENVETLILMRALMGIAAATFAPSTLSLIRNMFHDEHERSFAIAIWITSFSLGGMIGPLVGGILLEYFWWGAGFLVALPVMALLLLLGPVILPEYKDPGAGRLDILSAVLSLCTVLLMIFGLKQLATEGVGSQPVLFLLAGMGVGYYFIHRQKTIAYPLLDIGLFANPKFSASVIAFGTSCLVMFGVYIYITQYLQLVLGLSALWAGIYTIPWAASFIVGSLLTPKIARSFSPGLIVTAGLALAAAGFALLFLITPVSGLGPLVAGMVIMGLGLAPVFTLGNDIIVSSAPAERAGSASAISETCSEFCSALGIAVFGSLGNLFYRVGMNAQITSVHPHSLEAEALTNLGNTLTASQGLANPVREVIVISAKSVFVDSMHIASLFAALLLVCASVLIAKIMKVQKQA
jgi:DHA2 family multidrug resistance protein-like MFS transporter